jgi:hypothetical protein
VCVCVCVCSHIHTHTRAIGLPDEIFAMGDDLVLTVLGCLCIFIL